MMPRALVILAVALLCVCGVFGAEQGPECVIDNDCVATPDTPLCRYVVTDETVAFPDRIKKCLECDPGVSPEDNAIQSTCSPGYFCARRDFDADEYYTEPAQMGTCVKMDFPIGEPCREDVTQSRPNKGSTDELYCGFVSKWCTDQTLNAFPDSCGGSSQNGDAALFYTQWTGHCYKNRCYACEFDGSLSGLTVAEKMCAVPGSYGTGGSPSEIQIASAPPGDNNLLGFKFGTNMLEQSVFARLGVAILMFIIFILITQCLHLVRSSLPF